MALSEAEQKEYEALKRTLEARKRGEVTTARPGVAFEPTPGEEAYGAAYGALTSFPGQLGDVERLAFKDIPEFFGGPQTTTERLVRSPGAGAAAIKALTGRETALPTTEEIRSILSKVGVPQPRPDVSGFVTAGELGAGLVPTGLSGVLGGKFLAGTPVGESLRGVKTARGAAALTKEAKAAEEEAFRRLSKERGFSEEQINKELERRSLAQRTGEKQVAASQRSLADVLGTRIGPEFGVAKPIPQTTGEVGTYMRDQAENFLNAIKTRRSEAAETNFKNTLASAREKEAAGQIIQNTEEFGKLISFLDNRIKVITDPTVRRDLETIKKALTSGGVQRLSEGERRALAIRNNVPLNQVPTEANVPATFEGIEIMRRRIGDAAFGSPEEGYKAIGQNLAKDIYKTLTESMRKYDSNFGKYLDDYKKLSEPIEVYGTKVGKGITETQDASGKYYAKTAEQVAKDIFSSPEKYAQFVDAVGGNKQITEAAARRYFSGQLEKQDTPEKVRKFFADNRQWFGKGAPLEKLGEEFQIKYYQPLATGAKRAEAASDIIAQSKEVDKQLKERLKGVAGSETLFSDAVKALTSAEPKKVVSTFEKTVLPRIREAEERSGVTLISPQQLEKLRTSAGQLETVANKQTRDRYIAGALAAYLLGQGVVTGGTKVMGQ
jgi:hypothetical protein